MCAYQHIPTCTYTYVKPEIDQGDEVMIIFLKIFFIKASRRGGRPRGYQFWCKHETVLGKYIPTVNVDPSKIQSLIILSLICTSLSCGTVVVFISLITTSLLVTSLPQ
jgi:hypothetical protein